MILPLLLTPILLFPIQNATAPPPPGLVALGGGRTTIGSSVKEIEKLVEDSTEAKTLVRALDGETPQYQTSIEAFYLGVTEVTQEQFAAFVKVTGYRPPQDWGAEAIEGARQAFFEDLNLRRLAGESVIGEKFDPEAWWSENWGGLPWDVPEGSALRPVVSMDFEDAMAYSRWAGVRLPTEFEYQHAVRGRTKDPYPWGDDWEDGKYCATNELPRVSRSYQVGSFQPGASRDGVHDLAGNVWEWTMSPYQAFPEFEKNEYRIPGQRKRQTVPTPKWDGNQRVVVGGSYQNSKMAARCTVRRGTDRDQRTNALGFRIAATPSPARDYVQHLWNKDLRNADGRPTGVTYDLEAVMGQDLWLEGSASSGAPEGYRVIAGYEHLAFVPRATMEETGDVPFRKASLVEPQHLGFLTLSTPILDPALPAGTYLIAFRAAGETRLADQPEEEKTEEEEGEGEAKPRKVKEEDPWAKVLNIELDNMLLMDPSTGELLAHQPIEGVRFGKSDGKAGFSPVNRTKVVEDPANPEKTIEITERVLRIRGEVATRIRRHVLPFALDLKIEPEYWDKKWRE